MDSLRYWVEMMHVDGFRFDLCSTLGRTRHGFERDGPFFRAIGQDPILNKVKLIAEPWDIGPGGYQLGAYPAPFAEWNDKYRDETRSFWRGDKSKVSAMAARLSGSAQFFDHSGRAATARTRRKRNMIATLMLSQGTPMMLAGDELSNSQGGNNNTYCQDNEIGWVNWPEEDDPFFTFCQQAIAFRKMHPLLRQRRFLHSRQRLVDGEPDLFWRRADGGPMRQEDWDDPKLDILVAEMRMASGTPEYVQREGALLVVLNRGDAIEITPPALPDGGAWVRRFDTSQDDAIRVTQGMTVAADAVVVFSHEAKN